MYRQDILSEGMKKLIISINRTSHKLPELVSFILRINTTYPQLISKSVIRNLNSESRLLYFVLAILNTRCAYKVEGIYYSKEFVRVGR